MSKAVTLEVSGEWAGTIGGWRPAVSGSLNQTNESDEHASLFTDRDCAMSFFEDCILADLIQGDMTSSKCHFRIVGQDWAERIA